MRSDTNSENADLRQFKAAGLDTTSLLPTREEILADRSLRPCANPAVSAEQLFGDNFSFAACDNIYASSNPVLIAQLSEKSTPRIKAKIEHDIHKETHEKPNTKATDKIHHNKSEDVPKTAVEWTERLNSYEAKLTKELGHKPSQADFARRVVDAKTSGMDALYAALEYAYGIRTRNKSLGVFAETEAPKMLERSKAKTLNPAGEQIFESKATHQNYPDDCPFMATLIGLARTEKGRSALANMVASNDDGSYEVYFPGKAGIHVPKLTSAEKMIGASNDQKFLLPTVLEKAYGIYSNRNQKNPTIVPAEAANSDFFNSDNALKMLTGCDVVEHIKTSKSLNPVAMINENIFQEALNAKERDAIALVGILVQPDMKNLHKNHAYLVLDYDKDHIYLSDPTVAGSRIPLTWKQFNDNCNELMIQKKKGN